MPRRRHAPTVAEVLDDGMHFRPAALQALQAFKRERPWAGTPRERGAKFRRLNDALAAAYGIAPPRLRTGRRACYRDGVITLDKLSVVTYLHEFGHALGKNERQACRWSLNLFRKVFPRSFARCVARGHMLIRERRPRERRDEVQPRRHSVRRRADHQRGT